jgi:hypothetical protein
MALLIGAGAVSRLLESGDMLSKIYIGIMHMALVRLPPKGALVD